MKKDRFNLDMLPRKRMVPYLSSPLGRRMGVALLHICQCSTIEKRGPKGGVCGRCGCAIPDKNEAKLFKIS